MPETAYQGYVSPKFVLLYKISEQKELMPASIFLARPAGRIYVDKSFLDFYERQMRSLSCIDSISNVDQQHKIRCISTMTCVGKAMQIKSGRSSKALL